VVEAGRMTLSGDGASARGVTKREPRKKSVCFPFSLCVHLLRSSLMTLFSDVRFHPSARLFIFTYHHPVTYPPTSFWVCCLIVCGPAYMYPTPPSRYVLPSCSLTTPIVLGVSFDFRDTLHDSSGPIFPTVLPHPGRRRPYAS
jgi:hypothetical protein